MDFRRAVPRLVLAAACAILAAGCVSTQPVPSDITLRDALLQVKDGLHLLQERQAGDKQAGLLISEVQVTFNITANAKESTKLGLDLAPGGITKLIPTGSFEAASESGWTRGNQISFKFQNLFLANKDTLIGIAVTPVTSKAGETTATPMTLEQLYNLLDSKVVIKAIPPR